jgi:long-chain acyl-CoA synthetase
MSLATLNDVFFTAAERNLDRAMLYRQDGKWLPISSADFRRSVVATTRALQEWGVRKGDRVAILSENRPEWSIADFAVLLLGAVTVPVYATLTPEQTAYTLRDSGASVIFVSTEPQLCKIQTILLQTQIQKMIVMDHVQIPGDLAANCVLMNRFMTEGPINLDPQTESFAHSIQPDDLATIIYTSGTTGTSKGAMLTHGNMASNIACSLLGFDMRPGLISISFLPLSHVTARHVDLAMLYHGVTLAYCPFIENLPQTLQEVRPTLCVSVPRVYEKIYAKTESSTRGFPKRAIYRWALSVGRTHKPEILAGETPTSPTWKLANKLVFSKIRAGMGGNVETFISGGAPLGRELAEWFATVGIRIHEG